MNCARSCENLLNFVKVMPKIILVPFFPDTVYITLQKKNTAMTDNNSQIYYTDGFYRAMLRIRGTSHGPVSVSVCHKSEFY